MYLYHLRRRVDSLKRKLAVPLSVVRLRPLAEEYCDQWAAAVADDREPPPASPMDLRSPAYAANPLQKTNRPFFRRIADAGFRLNTFMVLQKYTRNCRDDKNFPQPNEILRSLLPSAARWGLIPKSPPSESYRPSDSERSEESLSPA